MEALTEYGIFLAETVTVVLAILVIIGRVAFAVSHRTPRERGHIEVNRLGRQYDDMADTIQGEILPPSALKHVLKHRHADEKEDDKAGKKQIKALKAQEKAAQKTDGKAPRKADVEGDAKAAPKPHGSEDTSETDGATKKCGPVVPHKKTVFVLDFEGDIRASAVAALREEVTAILTVATPDDEVLVKVESPGGMVHSYGLAASQLMRIKQRGIPLTVAVDQIAASGGYLMACTADRLMAAPFAVIGSIGVVAQLPNFNKVLRRLDIDYEQLTAGEYKRTLTMFGRNTADGRAKFQSDLEDVHTLFKDFIRQNRPEVDIPKVATGEHWHGMDALKLALVDELRTSDDYLLSQHPDAHLLEVHYVLKKTLGDRLAHGMQMMGRRLVQAVWRANEEQRHT